MRGLKVLVLVLFAGFTGCGETVDLFDESGTKVLSYSCVRFRPLAETEPEKSIVRDFVTRMVRHAAEAEVAIPLDDLLRADAAQDYASLERLVVQYLCAGGEVASRQEIDEEPLVFRAEYTPPEEKLLPLGVQAPEFSLPILARNAELQGADSTSSSSLSGDRVLLYFWGTWCGPCREDIPELVALERDLRGTGVRLLGVVCRESPEKAREWLSIHGFESFPNIVDEKGVVQEAFGVTAYSTTYQLGPAGVIERAWIGWNPPYPDSLKKDLASLRSNPTSRDSSTH